MPQLTTPLVDSKLKLHNRLVMPPMATDKADEDGKLTKATLEYYKEKSLGGHISLVIVEHSYIALEGKAGERQMSVARDSDIEPLRELATILHANGSKAAMQINHAGSKRKSGLGAVGPSAVAHPATQTVPATLSLLQIQKIIEQFQASALRTKKAGFDAVEIHAAHGFLLHQFYSPLTNHRTDEYGGGVYARIRLHLQIIEAIREAVGPGFPIMLRLGGSDYRTGGIAVEDSIVAAREFEKAGLDLLDISGGFLGFMHPTSHKPGYFSDISLPIMQAVDIPVLVTGGVTTRQQADDLLARDVADLIGVGRAIMKDSLWAQKAMT
ncbi:MAG: NADH:flavin oxidoreductase [Firmicutes bacterium]|nr:NADH:flavin oxidoreductase [Bacillota bacterium]